MNKKLWIIFLSVILLACNFLSQIQQPPTKEPGAKNQPQQIENLELDGFTIVRLHPADGDLQAMLKSEAQKATARGLMPTVEFDATWCPPCQAIDEGILSKNKLMMDAYKGTYIIKLDVDEWGWDASKVQNFTFTAIPVYFKLDKTGMQTGAVIDGNAWGDNIPENIAPPMDKFFHGGS